MDKQPKTNEPKKAKGKKQYKEADMIMQFKLKRIIETQTDLMKEWLDTEPLVFNLAEQYIFDRKIKEAFNNIPGWGEEELKMKFISFIIELGSMNDAGNIVTFYDRTISAVVDEIKLTVKPDFIMAKGLMDVMQNPYFHFQEYKPHKNPTGDPMAQLLQAFLIAQVINGNENPLYGVEIFGADWRFVIMEGREYCVSATFDSRVREELLKIIAMLRKFRHILETRLMVNDEL